MNCKQAREIINQVFDGEHCPSELVARRHVDGCTQCREWLAGMERTVELVGSALPPAPVADIAGAVMSRLPERHPASVEKRVLISHRALAWMGAGWAAALVTMALFAVMALRWFETPSGAEHIVSAVELSRGILVSLGALLTALKPFVKLLDDLTGGLRPHWRDLLLGCLMVDSVAVWLVYTVWRKRARTPSTMSVLI